MYIFYFLFFFFKQKTAYEMLSCDWSSDVCSSDLVELQNFRPIRSYHDSCVQDAGIGPPFAHHPGGHALQHLGDLLMDAARHRGRRNRTHAARIGAAIAVASSFVVPGGDERPD